MIDVVCGVIKNGDKYLITQRGDKMNEGKWEFPGGKVKENEHLYDSIKRELLEELELDVTPIRKITSYTFQDYNLTFILCKPHNISSIKLKEHKNLSWIEKNDFQNYNFLEGDVYFIKKYIF
ncbi:MAG: NUDIX domain-containing protein [Flavobacteriaceae bacterium]|nr:NUDIX domain-containing protein [Flavobacteriaceae bacterium]